MKRKSLLTLLAICVFSATAFTQAGAETIDATEVNTLCREFPFSSDADPTYGCMVAGALDMSMPGTINQVAARYKKWGPKQRKYYTETRLPKLTRWYTYAAYFHKGATKNAMFRKNHTDYMTDDTLATFLKEPATRLDVVRAMRPKPGSRSRRASKRVKRTRLTAMSKKKGGCQKACPAP
jgi:hypothetical protein